MKLKLLLTILYAGVFIACDPISVTPVEVIALPSQAEVGQEVFPESEAASLAELPTGGVYGEVTEVHDGDTIWVRLNSASFKVRYIGINAPEIGDNLQPFGNEATAYNRELVENQTVYLVQDVSDTDQYGRLLRYVFVDNMFVNAELVRVGLARAKNYPPDTLYSGFLFEMQDAAKAARLGIWSQ